MSRFIMPRQGVKGQNLNPADGALLFFYTVGTTAFKDTFTDAAKSIASTNPVVADGTGLFAYIEIDGSYDVVLKNKNGVQLWGPETIQELIDSSENTAIQELTTATMAADTNRTYLVGDVVQTKEWATGYGADGGALYDVVLTSSVTPDLFSILIGTANALISFVLRDTPILNAKHYGAAGDGTTDDTAELQAFIDASSNNRGYIPAGRYRVTSTLILDPTLMYWIEGSGHDPNASTTTVIYNVGSGHAITIDNNGAAAVDNLIVIRGMTIQGNLNFAGGQNGIYADNIHGLRLEKIWVTQCYNHGIEMIDCWGSTVRECIVAQNGLNGLFLHKRNNNVLVEHSAINGNSRRDGYSNIALTGTSGFENLGIVFDNVDFSSGGSNPITSVTTAFNMIVNNTHGLVMIGCYTEIAVTQLLNIGANVKGINLTGNYFQDGIVEITAAEDGVIEGNIFQEYSIVSGLIAAGTASSLVRVGINNFLGGATEVLNGGALKKTTIGIPLFSLREGITFDVGNIAANGGLLASDTTPALDAINAATDGCQRISWVSSNNDQLIAQLTIPNDIDTSKDMEVHFRILSSGVTDAVGFLVTSFFNEGDTSIADNTSTNGTAFYADVFATIAAADIPSAAQTMTVGFAPIAHTSDTLKLTAVWIEYVSLRRTN